MATNSSIYTAFERMWHHVLIALNSKASMSDIPTITGSEGIKANKTNSTVTISLDEDTTFLFNAVTSTTVVD